MEWGEYLAQSTAKDRDGAVLLGWTGDNGDPDNFLGVLFGCAAVGGNNRAQWCNKDFEDLIQKAKTTIDQAERTKLYEQAQVVFKEQAPWATIAHSIRLRCRCARTSPATCRIRSASTASTASTRPSSDRSTREAGRTPGAAPLASGDHAALHPHRAAS